MFSDDFKRPGQATVLVQVAHKDLPCRTANARAGFRILGCFPSNETAAAHFKRGDKNGYFSGLSAVVSPTFADILIPCRSDQPADALEAKARWLCQQYADAQQDYKKKFEARVDAFKGKSPPPVTDDAPLTKPAAPASPSTVVDTEKEEEDDIVVSRDGEVRGQNFCVCSIVVDTFSAEQEDIFTVYACCDDITSAQQYMAMLRDVVRDRNLYIVNMYSWVYPYLTSTTEFKKNVPRQYRETILQDLLVEGKRKQATMKKILDDNLSKNI
jgi:hypothetical protein